MEMPSGIVIFEDPPTHTIHRALLSRMFTPRQVARLEPQIRQFCADVLDPLVDSSGFDVIAELGAVMPARVIGMLMGLPDEDAVEGAEPDHVGHCPPDGRRGGQRKCPSGADVPNDFEQRVGEYLDWRAENPSDDIMSDS